MKKKQLMIAAGGATVLIAACAAALWLLRPAGAQLPAPPEDYELDGDRVESLNAVLGEEDSGRLTEMDTPQTRAAAPASSSASGSAEADSCLYTYEKLATSGESVRQYVEKLTDEENGFQIVDADNQETDAPDYTAEEGAVALAKTSEEDGRLLRLDIQWAGRDCTITLTRPSGTLTVQTEEREPLTYNDAVNFLKSQSPAALGLEGDSMSEYSVYPMDGIVMVDGQTCLKLQVYPPHGEGEANQIAGTYLLSGDQQHLYELEDGSVRECPLS